MCPGQLSDWLLFFLCRSSNIWCKRLVDAGDKNPLASCMSSLTSDTLNGIDATAVSFWYSQNIQSTGVTLFHVVHCSLSSYCCWCSDIPPLGPLRLWLLTVHLGIAAAISSLHQVLRAYAFINIHSLMKEYVILLRAGTIRSADRDETSQHTLNISTLPFSRFSCEFRFCVSISTRSKKALCSNRIGLLRT